VRPPGRIGRDGFLRLGFEERGGRTVLTERRFTLPLQALEPVDLDGSGDATLMLLNPTGGLLAGDVLDTAVALGRGSRVCLTTLAATRVYRSPGLPAVQRFRALVGEEAVLEYLPDHLIPSPGARLRQTTDVLLASTATLLLIDAWAVGRAARGEAWGFSALDSELSVHDGCGLLLKERCLLDHARRDGLGFTEGFPYVATFAALAPARGGWGERARALSARFESTPGGARCAVTALGRGGLVARLLAPSAPALYGCVEALWTVCRFELLGRGPLSLRKF